MEKEQQQLSASMVALEAQRGLLGDAVVDAALGPMRARLQVLSAATPELAETPKSPAQTLRLVSILFLDAVGSTALAQRLDPEDVGAVMDGTLARGTAVVEAHRGRVLQYAGDNILAVFGADEASEDDAERAVRCGLAMLELGRTLGAEVLESHGYPDFNVRVGIHTGSVLLGAGVDEDGSIRGQAVNIAARMEQSAPGGALRISHDTYVQVRGMFEVSASEPLTVRGVDQPIVTYLVFRAKPRSFRVATRGIEGVATRMIGRESEFETLHAAFERLFTERRLVAVSVVADAGIGKSRLLDEFQAWTEDRPETVYLFRGRATPRTQGQPFGLLRDIIGWRLQLSDDDTLQEAKLKIERGIIPLFADEPESAERHAHLLGHVIGLDWKESPHLRGILDDPKQVRNGAQHAAAQMIRRVSAQDGSPVILQLEDLHWADDETLDFLNYLAEVNRDMPLLMLAFTRPTLFERRTGWLIAGAGKSERIDLQPLDKGSSRLLADELLKKLPKVPVALRELITGGAEGNPFYMEELVRMLIDQRAIDASRDPWRLNAELLLATNVPPTLTGVLQARLDGLPADERLTLQEASVIGQVFWDRALVALDGHADITLPRLVRRELALAREDGEVEGMREYAFKHAILHQVTYGTVLKRQRKLLHARLADWMAAQSTSDSARAGDFLGMTALHYREAGDVAGAVEFHARAAEHATGRMAHGLALTHVEQALVLLDRAGDDRAKAPLRWRLLVAREKTLEMQGDREGQATDLVSMEAVAETLDDDAARAYNAHRRANRAMRMAQPSECEGLARRAATLAQAALDCRARGSIRTQADDGLEELRLSSLRQVGLALTDLGRWEDAQALLQQTLDEARARELLKPQITCLNSLAVLADRRGDHVRGLELHRESLAKSREGGGRRSEAVALANVGAKLVGLGDLVGAQRDLEEALRLARQIGDRVMECATLCNSAKLALLQGDDARALASARCAREIAVAMHARDLEVAALLSTGGAEEALGRLARAAEAYDQSHRAALEIRSDSHFDASAGLARVALAQGNVGGAMEALHQLLSPGGSVAHPDAAREACVASTPIAAFVDHGAADQFEGAEEPRMIELTIYRVLSAARDPHAAHWLERAYRSLMVKAGAITDAALRQMFLTNIPHHCEIVTSWKIRDDADH